MPSTLFLIYLMLIASKTTYIYLLLLVIFGLGFHFVQKFAKHYKWCEYVEAPVRRIKLPKAQGTASVSSDGTPSEPC